MNKHFEGEDLETRVQQLEEAIATLRGDSRLANLPYGTLKQAASMLSIRSVGGALGGAYPAGILNMDVTPAGTTHLTDDRVYAAPFYLSSVPNLVTKIGLKVTSGSAGNIRLGIYADKGEAKLYPHKLLLDAGTIDTVSTGVKSITVRQELPRGLVWIAMLQTGTGGIAHFQPGSYVWTPLGWNEDGTTQYAVYYVAQAYGALPDPYPAGGTEWDYLPYIFLKFG